MNELHNFITKVGQCSINFVFIGIEGCYLVIVIHGILLARAQEVAYSHKYKLICSHSYNPKQCTIMVLYLVLWEAPCN